MDTTKIEYTAEDLIAHKLQRENILIAKPKFDRGGCDLIALLSVKEGASFCRIQSKGITLHNSSNSNITIPCRYVTDSLVVFLYIEETKTKDNLYCFFPKNIRSWTIKDNKYVLNFEKATYEDRLSEHLFDEKKVTEIRRIIACANVKQEMSLIIGLGSIVLPVFTIDGKGRNKT
jgi:hypothetical protein